MYDEWTQLYYDKGKIVSLSFLTGLFFELLINNKNKVVTYKEFLKEIYHDNGEVTENKKGKVRIVIYRLKKQLKGFVKIEYKRHFGFYIEGVEWDVRAN